MLEYCDFHCIANHGIRTKRICISSHKIGKWDENEHYHENWSVFGNIDCVWK